MANGPEDPRALRPGAVLLFYGLMAGVALAWTSAVEVNLMVPGPAVSPLWVQASSGAGVGLAVVLASRWASFRLEWAKRLNAEFSAILGPLSTSDVFFLAAGSALGEEMLFRGAMQSSLGYVVASIVFGLAHLPPRRDVWPWTAWAVIAGFALGGLVWATGTLLAPIVAHFTINWFNLHALGHDPGANGTMEETE